MLSFNNRIEAPAKEKFPRADQMDAMSGEKYPSADQMEATSGEKFARSQAPALIVIYNSLQEQQNPVGV